MNISELKELIDFLRENGVSEFESNENGRHIKLSLADFEKQAERVLTKPSVVEKTTKAVTERVEHKEEKEIEDDKDLTLIKSPIVGTFYSKPAPDAEPFVQVGDRVKKGQVLCIIEAMKVMNEIESTADGIISEVCVNNQEIVEYSQVLFKIK
ncbi:MAG: acetyl-CoA carboxylase biotin carboxyl carrier protein [Bdellovibrionota bacterium]